MRGAASRMIGHLVFSEVENAVEASSVLCDPAASYPWSSDDPRLSASGIMGDPRGASAAHGEILIARVVEGAGAVMRRLKHNAATKRRG